MRVKVFHILTLYIILVISGCADNPSIDVPIDDNLIFPLAFTIEIISPNQGDTLGTIYPNFFWDATLKADSTFEYYSGVILPTSEMFYIGIFKTNISSSGSEINNIEDNIWGWHSGLGKGRIGSVSFDDGLDVVNGQLQINNQPTPLMPNTTYAYAIWAWDEEGRILASSREIVFVTGN